jgi:exopolysaccharide biosynthesis polyprenyl glycosylphosphotransferase
MPYFRDAVFLFIIWATALVIFLKVKHLYATDRSLSIPKETSRVFLCVVLSSVLAGLMIFILQIRLFSRMVFFQNFLLLFIALALWRMIKRLLIRYRITKGYLNYNVLIVGAGQTGVMLVNEIKHRPYLGLKIAGFFDSHKCGRVAGYPILSGSMEEFSQILQKHFIDEVYITIPSERDIVANILSVCSSMNKTVRVVPDHFTLPFYHLDLGHLGLIPMIRYLGASRHGTEMVIKRFFDLCVSMAGLVLLSPIFILIGILIKIDSPGPVFYKSLRCGKKGKPFYFYKFRSMVDGADKQKASLRERSEVKGPIFKMRNDPRVTKIGRFLRRYSLDELPQLFNVFKGDMSLVGPRPPTPDEVKEYDVWQMRRLDVRPGITCLWQVRGRSDLSFYKWVKWDLWYIDNWSFGLDFIILLWTIPVVLKRKGAY